MKIVLLMLPTVPVPVHHMKMFYNSAAEPDRELLKNETANLKLCADKISKQMTVEKMDMCSFVGVGIDPWRN